MKDLMIELDYILQKSRKDDNSDFESVDHIFRLSEKHNIAKGLIIIYPSNTFIIFSWIFPFVASNSISSYLR